MGLWYDKGNLSTHRTMPKQSPILTPGQWCKLKGTPHRYRIHAIFSDNAVIPEKSEEWCRLTTEDGKPAFWKVNQLEPIG